MSDVPIYEAAIVEVQEQFDLARDFAVAARTYGEELLNELAEITESITGIDTTVSLEGIDLDPSVFSGEIPTKPDTTMTPFSPPAVMEFKGLDLSGLEIPDLSEISPHVGDINAGATVYESALLTALKSRLVTDVSGEIDRPSIETSRWDRARERLADLHDDNLDKIRADWSKSGLPLPDGALLAAIESEDRRHSNEYTDLNRVIAIEESNLAIKVRQEAVSQAIQLEGILMNFFQNTENRLFEASKATVRAQVDLFNLVMMKKRMLTDIYQAVSAVKISEAKTLVDISLSEAIIYKTKTDAEVARIEAITRTFVSEVDLYRAQIQAYQALSASENEILRTRTQLAVSRVELYLKNADIQIKQAETNSGLRIEAAKAMGAIIAQEIAGALSSISARASMSREDSAGYRLSVSRSE